MDRKVMNHESWPPIAWMKTYVGVINYLKIPKIPLDIPKNCFTLQGTNISTKNGILKMIFLFPRWDMLIPWRVIFLFDTPRVRSVANETTSTRTWNNLRPLRFTWYSDLRLPVVWGVRVGSNFPCRNITWIHGRFKSQWSQGKIWWRLLGCPRKLVNG